MNRTQMGLADPGMKLPKEERKKQGQLQDFLM
jgi:hypothetical protein